MIGVKLICVGKMKEKHYISAFDEYKKRLGAYCKFELIELSEQRLGDNPSEKEILSALEKEAEMIKKHAKGYIIPMCIEGKQLSSTELSEKISSVGINGQSTITFIIGSSFGLADSVKSMADLKLSMSKRTIANF